MRGTDEWMALGSPEFLRPRPIPMVIRPVIRGVGAIFDVFRFSPGLPLDYVEESDSLEDPLGGSQVSA